MTIPNIKNLHVGISITTLITVMGFIYYATTYKTNVDRDIIEIQSQVLELSEKVSSVESDYTDLAITLTRIDERTANIEKRIDELVKKNN